MKIWIVSDLHTNASPWSPATFPDHDVTVVAGDVADDREDALIEIINLRARTRRPIVFVPGNHDAFGSSLDAFNEERRLLVVQDIHVLSCGQTVVIDGVRFVGATLWTDWHLTDSEWASQAAAARSMPEYAHVQQPSGELIWPIHTAQAHDVHRAAIEAVLRTPHFGPTVVATHHAPSPRSIKGRPQPEDAAFASNLEDLIWQWQPELWVHGHVHHARDYRIGSTRVVCNPRGYRTADWSEQTGFVEDFIVEV